MMPAYPEELARPLGREKRKQADCNFIVINTAIAVMKCRPNKVSFQRSHMSSEHDVYHNQLIEFGVCSSGKLV